MKLKAFMGAILVGELHNFVGAEEREGKPFFSSTGEKMRLSV
jgi:hypothetical protein